jgi:MFS family permease
MSICTLIGKLAGGFGDRIDPRYLWSLSMSLFGAGLIYAPNASARADLYFLPILLGIGWGGTLVSMMTVPVNYYGPKAYAALVGIMMAIQTTSSAIAPIVAGYWFDTRGTYAPVFYVISVMCFAGAVILMLAPPPRRAVRPETAGDAARSSGVPSGI